MKGLEGSPGAPRASEHPQSEEGVVTRIMACTRIAGLELPFEAKQALRTLPTLDGLEVVLEAVLAHITGSKPASAETARALQRATTLDTSKLGALFTGLDWLLRTCIRSSLKSKLLHAELTDARVHQPCIDPILAAVERG